MMLIFLYSLAGGMLAVLATARLDLIAWRFLRLVGLIALALSSVATVWLLRDAQWRVSGPEAPLVGLGITLAVAAMVSTFLSPVAPRLAGTFKTVCVVGGVCGLVAACALSNRILIDKASGTLMFETAPVAARVMVVVSETLGTFVMGSITVAWLLGHAYLTATKMTIAPLQHFSRMLLLAMGARVLFFGVSATTGYALAGSQFLSELMSAWLVLSLRAGVGLVAVSVFAFMVLKCVKLRATQSATGILYFASLFAYMGEFASREFVSQIGWPL